MSSLVNEGHLWVGWKSSNSGNAIISINAWEVPPPFGPPVDTSYNGTAQGALGFWFRSDANDSYAQGSYDGTLLGWLNLAFRDTGGPFVLQYSTGNVPELDLSNAGGLPALKIVGSTEFFTSSIGYGGAGDEDVR
jgi:hypothetical protein